MDPITKTTNNDLTSSIGNVASSLASKLSPFRKAKATPDYLPMPGTANSTPTTTYKNLSTNLGKLGAMTTNFGESTKFEKFHPGIDIANKMGTPIPSLEGGTVISVGQGYKQGDKGYGNTVIVQDAQGNKFRYSHLKQAYVKVGQKVGKGDEVGEMGNTGSTYSASGKGDGSHLDLRIKDAYGNYINPLTFLRNINS